VKKSNGTPESAVTLPEAIPLTITVDSPKITEANSIVKDIRSVEYFDKRRYKITFLDNSTRYIASVTTKLEEYRERGLEIYRETVGTDAANEAMREGGEAGSLVHHACFLLATGGAVLFEAPAYQTVGIENNEVAQIRKQNNLIREQLSRRGVPFLTIEDQFRYLQVLKFKKNWMDIVKPEVMMAEEVVYSLKHDVAGRIDFLFKVKEGDYMIAGKKAVHLPEGIILPDVKSGAWSERHFLQMAAYRVAVEESTGLEVVATVGIHLKAQTNTGLNTLVHLKDEAENDFKLFQHVAAIYDAKHAGEEPKEFQFESVLLSDQARGAIILGQILNNPVAEKQVAESIPVSIN
jgi:hypothetical protein